MEVAHVMEATVGGKWGDGEALEHGRIGRIFGRNKKCDNCVIGGGVRCLHKACINSIVGTSFS